MKVTELIQTCTPGMVIHSKKNAEYWKTVSRCCLYARVTVQPACMYTQEHVRQACQYS